MQVNRGLTLSCQSYHRRPEGREEGVVVFGRRRVRNCVSQWPSEMHDETRDLGHSLGFSRFRSSNAILPTSPSHHLTCDVAPDVSI